MIKMNLLAFTTKMFSQIIDFTKKYSDYFAINFAGHYHIPWHQNIIEGGYQIIIVNSLRPLIRTFKLMFYEPRIGILKVIPKNDKFEYQYKIVFIPYEGEKQI